MFSPEETKEYSRKAGFKIIAEKEIRPTKPGLKFEMEHALVLQK